MASLPTTGLSEKELHTWTVTDLKKLAGKRDISGRSKLTKKDGLVHAIVKSDRRNASQSKAKAKAKAKAKDKAKAKAKATAPSRSKRSSLKAASGGVDKKAILSVGLAAMKGRRDYMEDTWIENTSHRSGWKIFGVFDGHGGKEISTSLCDPKRGLAAYLIPKLARVASRSDVPPVVTEAIVAYDKKLFRQHGSKVESGSTGILLLLSPGLESGWLVNVGDSRAVWYSANGYIRQKTQDHKPRDPEELQRIRDAGGFIENDGGTWRVDGILALSRAFGDFPLKTDTDEKRDYEDGRVSSLPDVIPLHLNPMQSDVFVLASDGLWDEMNNRDVGSHVKTFGVSNASAQALIQKAYDIGSHDNITALMIQLDFPDDYVS